MSARESVLQTAEEAISALEPGATIGFGGIINSTHPMPIVREIIRRGVGDLHVVGLASGLEVDMLIAAGLVRRVTTPTVSAETLCPIAPAFRKAVEDGSLAVDEIDEGMIYAGLQASSQRLAFAPFVSGRGGSYTELNEGMVEFEAPYTGETLIAVRAIEMDWGFIHAARSDPFGNVQVNGGGMGDRALARASDRLVCTVDEVIGNHEVRRRPETTAIPGAESVVLAPFGSHPFASPGNYIHDEVFLREYIAAADSWLRKDDRSSVEDFFERWIRSVPTHWEYLDKLGNERLWRLTEALQYGFPGAGEEVSV